MEERMYNVVTRTIEEGAYFGVITWTSYADAEDFRKKNDERMRAVYEVIAEGVTDEEAVEMCSTPEAQNAALLAQMRETNTLIGIILKQQEE